MPDFLQQMAYRSRRMVDLKRRMRTEEQLAGAASRLLPTRTLNLEGFSVIAEFKRSSPKTFRLHRAPDIEKSTRAYEKAGATAVSVLTERKYFEGSVDDLRAARTACGLPVMCKDFLVDPWQVLEARVAGADGVLLIAAILDDATLVEMLRLCREHSMFALVEAFDALDLERAQSAGAEIVGVNCRDLRDLSVDFVRFAELRRLIDSDRIAIAESGISTPQQLQDVRALGYRGALIGSALMRADDPADELKRLLGNEGRP